MLWLLAAKKKRLLPLLQPKHLLLLQLRRLLLRLKHLLLRPRLLPIAPPLLLAPLLPLPPLRLPPLRLRLMQPTLLLPLLPLLHPSNRWLLEKAGLRAGFFIGAGFFMPADSLPDVSGSVQTQTLNSTQANPSSWQAIMTSAGLAPSAPHNAARASTGVLF